MADIGVLDLQIQSTASSAATNLGNLADALSRVKDAVARGTVGKNLDGAASALERIKRATTGGVGTTVFKNLTTAISEAATNLAQSDAAKVFQNTAKALERMMQAYSELNGMKNAVSVANGRFGNSMDNVRAASVMKYKPQQFAEKREGFEESTRAVENAQDAVANVASSVREGTSTIGDGFEETTRGAYHVENAMARVTESFNQTRQAEENLVDSTGASGRFTQFTDKIEESLSSFRENYGGRFTSFVDNFKEGVQNMMSPLSGLLKQFGRVAKYRALRAVLKTITEGVKEGTENMYRYSQAIGSSFAPAMDSMASLMAQFKNSIGAAAAPVLSAIIPVLNAITSAAITAANALSQLFALLGGATSWTKAVPQTTTAFNDIKKSAGGAGGAVKELLADFDELNVIASQGGGGGGGGGAGGLDAYLDMFEQSTEFNETLKEITDFIKDNEKELIDLAKEAGAAFLAWKVSEAFAGTLSMIAGLLAAAAVIDISWRMTAMLDNEYLKTGHEGWLIADVVTNAIGSFLAGKIVSKILGTGWGLVTAGFELVVSGAISYGIAMAHPDNDKADVLKTVGAIKAAIGDILMGAGFYVATGSFWAAAGAMAAGAVMFYIVANVEAIIQTAKSEQQMADDFFRESTKGGLSVEKVMEALQKHLDQATAPYELTINIFSERQGFLDQISEASTKITSLNSVITSGEMLTKDQAETFKEAWDTVFKAFEGANQVEWETIFEGFNAAMMKESETLRETAKEQRIIALQMQHNLSELDAQLVDEMNELVDKITKGTASDKEIEKYLQRMQGFASEANKTIDDFKVLLENAEKIDFSEAEEGRQAALDFINQTQEMYNEAIAKIDEGLQDQLDSIQGQKNHIDALVRSGMLDDETAKAWKQNLDDMAKTFKETAESSRSEVSDKMLDSYKLLLNTLKQHLNDFIQEDGSIDFYGASNFVTNIMTPILHGLEDAGVDVEKTFKEIFNFDDYLNAKEFFDNPHALEEFLVSFFGKGFDEAKEEVEDKTTEVFDAMNDAINEGLESTYFDFKEFIFGTHGKGSITSDWSEEFIKNNINLKGFQETLKRLLENGGVSSTEFRAMDLIQFSGWDLLSDDLKNKIAKALNVTGEEIQVIMDHWDLTAPEISDLTIEQSLESMKTLSEQTGIDIKTLISNWDLISPLIDPHNVTESCKTISDLINQNQTLWQLTLMQELTTGDISYPSSFGVAMLGKVAEIAGQIKDTLSVNATAEVQVLVSYVGASQELFSFAESVLSYSIGGVNKIFGHAEGAYGIPKGDLFIANENGAELIGSMGGKTAVANQGQIIEGISLGVAEANEEQNGLLREQNSLLRQLLQKDVTVRVGASSALGRTVSKSLQMYNNATGKPTT